MSSGVDINHDQFIGFLFIEDLHRIDGISDVFRVLEFDRLHQPTVLDEQAWNDPVLAFVSFRSQFREVFSKPTPKW